MCASWLSLFRCVVDFSVGAGCLAPGRSLLALFVNTAALLWLFVFFLIEIIFNWGLTCDALIGGPSPLHWMILVFAITGIVLTLAYFLFEIFTPPPAPPRSQLEAEAARIRRRGRMFGYACLLISFVIFGFVLLYFTLTSTWCPHGAPAVFRLAWLILLIWLALLLLLLCLCCFVCCDCCLTGRMRFIVVFTDRSAEGYKEAPEELPPGAPPPGPFIGAHPDDVHRVHREGDAIDRISGWSTVPTTYSQTTTVKSGYVGSVGNPTVAQPVLQAQQSSCVQQGGSYRVETSYQSYRSDAPPQQYMSRQQSGPGGINPV